MRPGQVYWNGKLGFYAVVCDTTPMMTRLIRYGIHSPGKVRRVSWTCGSTPPKGWHLHYDPPKEKTS